jgi:hypothetical protein
MKINSIQTEIILEQLNYIKILEKAYIKLSVSCGVSYADLSVAVAKAALKGTPLTRRLTEIEELEENLASQDHELEIHKLDFMSKLSQYQTTLGQELKPPVEASGETQITNITEASQENIPQDSVDEEIIHPQVELMLQRLTKCP